MVRIAPAVLPHQISKLRNRVSERATRMAKWHTAVHAAAGLATQCVALEQAERGLDLTPVADPFGHAALPGQQAIELEKASGLGHQRPPSITASCAGLRP